MKTIKTVLIALAVTMSMLAAGIAAWGAETSYIVNLHKKIKTDFRELDQVRKDTEPKVKKINTEITALVDQIENAEGEKRDALENKYYKLRAQELALRVGTINQADEIVSRLTDNMRALDSAMAEGYRAEDGTVLSKEDLPVIGGTLRGIADMLKPMSLLKPDDPRVQYLGRTLQAMDSRYRTLPQGAANKDSLAEKIAYMEDLHAFISSVRQNAESERVYLLSQIWTIMTENVAKVVASTARIVGDWNIGANEASNHKNDYRVERTRRQSTKNDGQTASGSINWDAIGKF
jgi:Skp family chaperone for outer membrane proteins